MTIQTAAGASLAVSSGSISAYTSSGYGALSYVTVGETSQLGEVGREYQLVTFDALANRATRKKKGNYNQGTISPSLALDPEDAGQVIMETASQSDSSYPMKMTLQDGTIYYFMGLVMSFRPSVQDANSIVMATCTIEVDENAVVKVAA